MAQGVDQWVFYSLRSVLRRVTWEFTCL